MNDLLLIIRALVANPAANPVAAAIGIVIVAVVFLLVILVLLAWALPGHHEEDEEEPQEEEPQEASARRRASWVAPVLIVAAICAGYVSTSSSAYCGRTCHSMDAPEASWSASGHAKTPCVRCHEGTPVLSAPSALISRSHSLFMQSTGRLTGGSAVVPDSRCLVCHAKIMMDSTVSKRGVVMNHAHVLKAGATCDDCHGLQGHGPSKIVEMARCTPCHNGAKAPITCQLCHTKSTQSLIAARHPRFGKVALKRPPTCGGCHSQVKCDACHGLRMPHPTDFAKPEQHARLAAFDGKRTLCYHCHSEQDCRRCHQQFPGHNDGFEAMHMKSGPAVTCGNCHKTANICSYCHSSKMRGSKGPTPVVSTSTSASAAPSSTP